MEIEAGILVNIYWVVFLRVLQNCVCLGTDKSYLHVRDKSYNEPLKGQLVYLSPRSENDRINKALLGTENFKPIIERKLSNTPSPKIPTNPNDFPNQ